MNDRYLFRGKDRNDGNWNIGFLTADRFGTNEEQYFITDKITGYHSPVVSKTVGQCTGLKDKNGKLIFENDILLFTNDDGEGTLYKVKWSKRLSQYIISCKKWHYDTMDYWGGMREYFKIVGNVTDNPELLEAEE